MKEKFVKVCDTRFHIHHLTLLLCFATLSLPIYVHSSTYYTSQTLETQYQFSVKTYVFRKQFTLQLANSSNAERDTVKTGQIRENELPQDDNEIMENPSFFPRYSLLLQILIFVCCAAGVSAVIILCCLICLHGLQFFSRSTVIVGEDGRVHMMSNSSCRLNLNGVQVQRNGNNETVLTFVPSHRHPWSPGMTSNNDNEHFTFRLEGPNDLPPSYDDLTPKDEEASLSSPPPPYTPSFNTKMRLTEQSPCNNEDC